MAIVEKAKEDKNNNIYIEFTSNIEMHPKDIVSVSLENGKIKLFTIIEITACGKDFSNVTAKMIKQDDEIFDIRKLTYQNIETEILNNEFDKNEDLSDDYKRGFKAGSDYALSTL